MQAKILFISRLAHTIFEFHDVASCAVRLLHFSLRPGAADGVLGKHEVARVVDALAAHVGTGRRPSLRGMPPGRECGGGVGGVEGGLEGWQEGLARPAKEHLEGAEPIRALCAPVRMQGLVVVGAFRRALDHEVFDLLHSRLREPVAGGVVGGGDLVRDVQGGEEVPELRAGELGSTIRADVVGEAEFPVNRVQVADDG